MIVFKNFFEDILQYVKNRLFSSKYVVKGECRQCGKCCKTIFFSDEEGYIKDEEKFRKLQKTNRRYLNFEINGKVTKTESSVLLGALFFRCKFLSEDNKCKKYFFRPLFCRKYPEINHDFIYNGGETLDGCGYHFDVDKKFKDYLKD